MTDTALATRTALPPEATRLIDEIPREAWETHPQFEGLVRFWLERHEMFRKLMGLMSQETQGFLDSRAAPQRFGQAISRYGGAFVNELHGHHQIEDHHYFPILRDKDPRIGLGFDILDADHRALDGLLNGFVQSANGAIQGLNGQDPRAGAGRLLTDLTELERQIGQHLNDEEDLVVPVILKFGAGQLG